MTAPSAIEQLDQLRRAVGRSRAAIADGAIIDLSGLDAEVARVTDLARNTPSAERAHVLAALDALLQEIDSLAATLARHHDAGRARQAAGAYRPEPGIT